METVFAVVCLVGAFGGAPLAILLLPYIALVRASLRYANVIGASEMRALARPLNFAP